MTRKVQQWIPKGSSHGTPFRDRKTYHCPSESSFLNLPALQKGGIAKEYTNALLTENPVDALHDSSHALSYVIHLETGTNKTGSYFKQQCTGYYIAVQNLNISIFTINWDF